MPLVKYEHIQHQSLSIGICLVDNLFGYFLNGSMIFYAANSNIVTLQQVVPNRCICFFESSKKNTLLISSHFIVIPLPFMKLTFLIGFLHIPGLLPCRKKYEPPKSPVIRPSPPGLILCSLSGWEPWHVHQYKISWRFVGTELLRWIGFCVGFLDSRYVYQKFYTGHFVLPAAPPSGYWYLFSWIATFAF